MYATTEGDGPFKPLIKVSDNWHFKSSKEFATEDEAFAEAERAVEKIGHAINQALPSSEGWSLDKR